MMLFIIRNAALSVGLACGLVTYRNFFWPIQKSNEHAYVPKPSENRPQLSDQDFEKAAVESIQEVQLLNTLKLFLEKLPLKNQKSYSNMQ
jgi:hypothetical protein